VFVTFCPSMYRPSTVAMANRPLGDQLIAPITFATGAPSA
jgi:hypothetical protein